MTRKDGRELDEIRRVEMLTGFTRFAEGSCLISVRGYHGALQCAQRGGSGAGSM